MANKTFHIPEGDAELWAALGRVAKLKRTSQYRVLRDALAAHLPKAAAEPAPAADPWTQLAADVA